MFIYDYRAHNHNINNAGGESGLNNEGYKPLIQLSGAVEGVQQAGTPVYNHKTLDNYSYPRLNSLVITRHHDSTAQVNLTKATTSVINTPPAISLRKKWAILHWRDFIYTRLNIYRGKSHARDYIRLLR